jgi:hypothetical protein
LLHANQDLHRLGALGKLVSIKKGKGVSKQIVSEKGVSGKAFQERRFRKGVSGKAFQNKSFQRRAFPF